MIVLTGNKKKRKDSHSRRFNNWYKKQCGECTTRKFTTEELAKLEKELNKHQR